jgi:hypothetical protein
MSFLRRCRYRFGYLLNLWLRYGFYVGFGPDVEEHLRLPWRVDLPVRFVCRIRSRCGPGF